jgi:hypothetical protein
MTTDTRTNADPDAIEQDIRKTQEDMSRTVDKIGDQLTIRNMFNALLDKADDNDVDARYLLEGARRNPIALGLIAAGAIWLVSDKDSTIPSMPSRPKKPLAGTKDEFDLYGSDLHHRDYVTHMSGLEIREGEDAEAYQRRRDTHRANFLMCERGQDEDESSFRKRLDEMTEKFREKRQAWSDSVGQTGSVASQRTRQFTSRASTGAQDLYDSSPLVGGILAAAVGAVLGSSIPVSRKEEQALGGIGSKALDMASEGKQQLTSQIRDKKEELIGKAEEAIKPQQSNEGEQQQPLATGDKAGGETPFILSQPS